jgi:predicted SAM-dependent methyltransferase
MNGTDSLEVKSPEAKASGEPVRLLLGGRTTKITGFTNVDLYEGPEVDIHSDVSDLLMFKDGSVSEIYASHILEHFSHTKTINVLKEWRRVLKSGGKAYIAVPDFDATITIYLKEGFVQFINNFLWGDQEYPLAYHYSGFTYPYLASRIIEAGFNDVKRIKVMPYNVKDCSHLIDTLHGIPLSLNVEAIV